MLWFVYAAARLPACRCGSMEPMMFALTATLLMTAALETSAPVYECADSKGAVYYREGACKSGDKLVVHVNDSGTPMVQRVPMAPKAPQYPTQKPRAPGK